MMNPSLSGLRPEQVEAARKLGEYVGARFTVERSENRFTLEFVPRKSPQELARVRLDLGQLVDRWVSAMATQLYNYLGIGGEIEDVG